MPAFLITERTFFHRYIQPFYRLLSYKPYLSSLLRRYRLHQRRSYLLHAALEYTKSLSWYRRVSAPVIVLTDSFWHTCRSPAKFRIYLNLRSARTGLGSALLVNDMLNGSVGFLSCGMLCCRQVPWTWTRSGENRFLLQPKEGGMDLHQRISHHYHQKMLF